MAQPKKKTTKKVESTVIKPVSKKNKYTSLGGEIGRPTGPTGPGRIAPTQGGAKSGKTIKKAQDGTSFAKLAPPFNKATYADKIAGATKNKAKSGTKVKKAMMGAMAKPMMKSGGSMKKCRYGCK